MRIEVLGPGPGSGMGVSCRCGCKRKDKDETVLDILTKERQRAKVGPVGKSISL